MPIMPTALETKTGRLKVESQSGQHREPLPENNRKKKKVEHLPKARLWAKLLVLQIIRWWLRGL